MLTLNDGRSELWQWDTGRTLAVDADCSQVHFSNKVFGRSIDVDVADGIAIIPDILLQTDNDLNVWAFVGTAENGYTKISKTFNVNRRNKPADYVFTPTDQMTLQTIQSQIGDLADLTTEAKDTLVAAINEAARTGGGAGRMGLRVADGYVQYSADGGSTWQNLIAVAELKGAPGVYYGTTQPTGDTHPVWIDPDGEHDDGGLLPAVTAADNGKVLRVANSAWSAEDMPTGGTDMGITGAAAGQIAKITAVDDTGKPTAWAPVDMPSGGGGSAETFELIKYIKTTEAVNEIRINADDIGEPFELEEVQIYTQLYLQDDAAAAILIKLHSSINGSTTNYDWPFIAKSPSIKSNTAAGYPAAYAGHFKPKDYTIDNKKYWVADTWSRPAIGMASADGAVNRLDFLKTSFYETHVMDAVRCVMINANNGAVQIGANSEIWIFGKRGKVT